MQEDTELAPVEFENFPGPQNMQEEEAVLLFE
jgi:hypothetical protein